MDTVLCGVSVITRQSERRTPLEGATNFRDAGGYETRDGRRVKWGHLFRSDSLASLTAQDLVYIETLGIRSICDLRRDEERDDAPSRIPSNGPEVIHFNIGPQRSESKLYEHLASDQTTADDIAQAMIRIYRSYAVDFRDQFAQFMRRVVRSENLPLLFHCAAGKDRTGFAAALVLSALQVPHETIIEDYVLTNRFLKRDPARFSHLPSPELFHTVMAANPDYLQAAFGVVDEEFGGVQAYLRNGLGMSEQDLNGLQAALLE